MGLLVDGEWRDGWYDTAKTGGRFVRTESTFRRWVRADPAAPFPAAAGRYHLYVSLACPWAHRVLLVRKLKRLEGIIGLSVVSPLWGAQGWTFAGAPTGADALLGIEHLHELYTRADPAFTGRVTVPALWDRERETIVNNESADLIRMLDREFDAFTDVRLDLYPEALRAEIDAINERVYAAINNGVYAAGFATTQAAYEEAYDRLFAALDAIEARLGERRYLCGARITEADWRLFTTLIRFDSVYYLHFKCNARRLVDYPNLWGYTRELYQRPGVAATVDLEQCKRHYYGSHASLNPKGLIPKGPVLDLSGAHGRERLPAASA
ncbi:MAG: glutathione S-transferase family protein [Nannocystaceae bacterium]